MPCLSDDKLLLNTNRILAERPEPCIAIYRVPPVTISPPEHRWTVQRMVRLRLYMHSFLERTPLWQPEP